MATTTTMTTSMIVEDSTFSNHIVVKSYNNNGHNGDDDGRVRKKRCPLHKQIRNQNWPTVLRLIRQDPSLIAQVNGVGWSSLILAIYHTAPIEVIAEMLHLSSSSSSSSSSHDNNDGGNQQLEKLLSQAVPTGNRLCLHFATRFSSSLEVMKLLTEPYPRALLHKSTDGATPLDRAIYYRKDQSILSWLEMATKQEEAVYELEQYNIQLKNLLRYCCEMHHRHCYYHNDNNQEQQYYYNPIGTSKTCTTCVVEPAKLQCHLDPKTSFFVQVYIYTKEREMIGLFDNILSYVGVHRIPHTEKVEFVMN